MKTVSLQIMLRVGVLKLMQPVSCIVFYMRLCVHLFHTNVRVNVCLVGCVSQMLMMSAVMAGSRLSQEEKG